MEVVVVVGEEDRVVGWEKRDPEGQTTVTSTS